MSFAYATIYAYIAFAAAGSLVFQILSWRSTRRAEAGRRQSRNVRHAAQALKQAA
jgi:hypothetical protein